VKEFSDALKAYGISRIHGDRYAGEWPREAFRKCGVEYRVADKTNSDLYLTLLPLLNSGRVELLDHKRLVVQLCGLERRTSRGGRDSIDHVPGGHDDVAKAVAGAAVIAAQAAARPQTKIVAPIFVSRYGAGAESATGKSTTQLFFESGGHGGGSSWPGSDRFNSEW
jgi:hypothetical protein